MGHPTETTPVLPGLPNEMVFKILLNLEDQTLFLCRLVNQGWCEVSSTILQSRQTVVVHPSLSNSNNRSLRSFIKSFKRSTEFQHSVPYANFVFGGFEDDLSKCYELRRFFALTKQSISDPESDSVSVLRIKCLRFDCIQPCQKTLRNLERIVFENVPQLRKLCLHFGHITKVQPLSASDASNQANIKMLPSLQVLQLSGCVGPAAIEFVTKILRAAPNLQRIEGLEDSGFSGRRRYRVFYMDHIQPFIDARKLYLVNQCMVWLNEKLVFRPQMPGNTLSGFQPTVLHLHLLGRNTEATSGWNLNSPQIKAVLQQLLWAAKDALEELQTDDSLGILDNPLKIPVFSKLRRLHWSLHTEGYPILPRGIRGQPVFPVLEKICLRIPKHMGEDRIFPDLGSVPEIPSVRYLEIQPRGTFTGICLESMTLMCPNLESLELSHCDYGCIDLSIVGPVIWTKMRGLKNLILDNGLLQQKNSLENIEAGFTGFSLEFIGRLKAKKLEDQPKVEDVKDQRVNHSILQMTEMKKLVINHVDKKEAPPLPLSFKYAFDLMPGLNVLISE